MSHNRMYIIKTEKDTNHALTFSVEGHGKLYIYTSTERPRLIESCSDNHLWLYGLAEGQ
jgi:hypothetical protein